MRAQWGKVVTTALLNVAAGDYGSLPNLVLFVAALCVALFLIPAGGPLVVLLTIRDIAALGKFRTEGVSLWLIRDLIGLGGVATLAYFVEKALIGARPALVRAAVVALITFFALAVALGAP